MSYVFIFVARLHLRGHVGVELFQRVRAVTRCNKWVVFDLFALQGLRWGQIERFAWCLGGLSISVESNDTASLNFPPWRGRTFRIDKLMVLFCQSLYISIVIHYIRHLRHLCIVSRIIITVLCLFVIHRIWALQTGFNVLIHTKICSLIRVISSVIDSCASSWTASSCWVR